MIDNIYLTDHMIDVFEELIRKYTKEIDNYDFNMKVTGSNPKWLWDMADEFLDEVDFNTERDHLVWTINKAKNPSFNNIVPTNLIFCSSLRPVIDEVYNIPPKLPLTTAKVFKIVGSNDTAYVMKIMLDQILK